MRATQMEFRKKFPRKISSSEVILMGALIYVTRATLTLFVRQAEWCTHLWWDLIAMKKLRGRKGPLFSTVKSGLKLSVLSSGATRSL